jgi:hypothetical protein
LEITALAGKGFVDEALLQQIDQKRLDGTDDALAYGDSAVVVTTGVQR